MKDHCYKSFVNVFCLFVDYKTIGFCSILSKYGVHGFPTLFLLNSTMRDQYRGTRSLGSLVAFYAEVTGKAFLLGLAVTVIVSFHDYENS